MVGVIPVTVSYTLGMIHLGIVFWTQSDYQGAHLLWVVLSKITSKNDCFPGLWKMWVAWLRASHLREEGNSVRR